MQIWEQIKRIGARASGVGTAVVEAIAENAASTNGRQGMYLTNRTASTNLYFKLVNKGGNPPAISSTDFDGVVLPLQSIPVPVDSGVTVYVLGNTGWSAFEVL